MLNARAGHKPETRGSEHAHIRVYIANSGQFNDNRHMSVLQALTTPTEPAITARGLTKTYGKGNTAVTALKSVDVTIGRGEFTAIMGPSGSGKSTLMHCLAGLDSITSGDVTLDGNTISNMSERKLTKLRRQQIGFIFQSFNLIPTLTAQENITLPADIAKKTVSKERFDTIVDAVGLRDRLTHRPAEMSGGQQQRVACARALITEPTVVFADEPTGNLDSKSSAQVLRFLREAVDAFDQTVVMVTHDPTAASHADRILFLVDGRIVAELREPTPGSVLDALRELDAMRETDPEAETTPGSDPEPAEEDAPTPALALTDDEPLLENQTTSTKTADFQDAERQPGETLDEALRRIAPTGELDAETQDLLIRAQKLLHDLPGSVIPEDDLELTGPIPIVKRVRPERGNAQNGEEQA